MDESMADIQPECLEESDFRSPIRISHPSVVGR